MLITLTFVWRMQSTVPIVAVLQLPTLSVMAAYALFLLDRDRRRSLKAIGHPVTTLLLVLLAVICLSIPFGTFVGKALSFLQRDYSKTFMMFVLVAACIRSHRDLDLMVGAQLLGALLYSLTILTKFSVGPNGRLGDLFYYDANDLAMILAMTLPLAVYFLRPGSRVIWRLVALATFGVILVAIVKTGSRGGFLGIVAVLAYLVIRFRSIPLRMRVGSVALFVGGMMLIGSEQYWSMMSTLLNPTKDYNYAGNSESGRVEVWKRGIGYGLSKPIFGVGVSNFGWAEGNMGRAVDRAAVGKGTRELAAHNSFVMAFAELGFAGLIVFCWLLVAGAQGLGRSVKQALAPPAPSRAEAALGQALTGSLIAYLVCGFFLSQTYSPSLHVLLGMIVALSKVQRLRVRELARVRAMEEQPGPSAESFRAFSLAR